MGGRSIVVAAEEPIGCPKCGQGFALSEGISRQAIERHAEDYERALGAGKKRLEAALAAEAKAQFDIQLKAAREALAARESVLDKFKLEELALRRRLRELEDKSRNQDLEYQRRLDEELKRLEAKTRASIGDEFTRREAQLKAQIESAQREAADLKRKLEQGSQQTQGEALEVSVEAMLKGAFPMDEVLPVPKGVNGADLLQRVRSPSGLVCGTIVREAKQTRNWSTRTASAPSSPCWFPPPCRAIRGSLSFAREMSGSPASRPPGLWLMRFARLCWRCTSCGSPTPGAARRWSSSTTTSAVPSSPSACARSSRGSTR